MSRIVTPEAVLSYPHLFVPQANPMKPDEEPKYKTALVFLDGTDISDLKKLAMNAVRERWGSQVGAKPQIKSLDTQHGPANFLVSGKFRARLPWRDAPEVLEEKGYPEGSTFINVSSTRKPQVVSIIPDANGDPSEITDSSRVYAGVIAKASVSVYTYDNSGNRGVSFGLGNVQIIRDGDRLDGSADARREFAADPSATSDLSDLENEDDQLEDWVAA